MTKILIAVDESDDSVNAARAAHRLFGDDADYLVINVGTLLATDAMAWGYAYPVAMPMVTYPPEVIEPRQGRPTQMEAAEDRAIAVAAAAHLDDAGTVGTVGDPADAILEAAKANEVDVIVVGSHDRNWFTRLLTGSVSGELVRHSEVPVLVVPPAPAR
jgi:nucleotide-binding universal stress UspA family protein